jgi:hypothetical protein
MWSLLQLAAALALPMLVLAVLFWFLMYSSFRLAFRHEVTHLEREEQERARAEQARARRRQEQARAAEERAQPRQARTQPASVRGDGQARRRPAPNRAGSQVNTQPPARERRAAS